MNGQRGVWVFFLFLLLLIIILLQILSMIQSDRLYVRINRFIQAVQRTAAVKPGERKSSAGLPRGGYPGDEGDWLIWRIGAEPATLNPIISRDFYTRWIVWGNVFEGLLGYDFDSLELRPLLADSYQVSADGLEITFRLRDDVYFSDGRKISPEDIIFSYETITNPEVDGHFLANYYYPVRQVLQIDGRGVKFVFRQPYFKALEIAGQMPILPRHIYHFSDAGEFNRRRSEPVGSGPYVFERWDVGREIVLARNENYWGYKPRLKKIVYRVITNDVAALQALRAHKIDFMVPSSEQFVELSEDKGFVKEFRCLSYWNPGTGYLYLGWNQSRPFFSDRRVRLAMTHLVDREVIIQHLMRGVGRVVTGPFYIFSPQYDSSIEPWPYDPARARELLNEAGWVDSDGDGIRDKDGVAFRFKFMIVSGYQTAQEISKLLKDELSRAGIELIPEPYEWSVFEERLKGRLFDATMLARAGAVQQDPYEVWHSSQIRGGGSNWVGFNHPQADAIMEEARRTLDEGKRNRLYHRLHRIIHDEQPYTFLRARPSLRFLDRRFENVVVHKLGLNPLQWYVPKEKQRYK